MRVKERNSKLSNFKLSKMFPILTHRGQLILGIHNIRRGLITHFIRIHRVLTHYKTNQTTILTVVIHFKTYTLLCLMRIHIREMNLALPNSILLLKVSMKSNFLKLLHIQEDLEICQITIWKEWDQQVLYINNKTKQCLLLK